MSRLWPGVKQAELAAGLFQGSLAPSRSQKKGTTNKISSPRKESIRQGQQPEGRNRTKAEIKSDTRAGAKEQSVGENTRKREEEALKQENRVNKKPA